MYTPIWNTVQSHFSAERMQAEIAEFFEFSRWSSFDKLLGLAQNIAAKMEAVGLQDVRLIEFPADGRTAYGGWVMPRAYDVHEARLTLLGEGEAESVLADYRLNPTCLMLYSLPTPPEGVTAELVIADTLDQFTPERLAGRLALTSGIGVQYSQAAMRAGALGVVSDCRNGHRWFKNSPEVDATNEWHNYTIPPWDDPNKGFGFSLSPQQGRQLRERLNAGQTVRLHALVQTRHYDGVLPVISARLPGIEPDEIALTGHYDEFGADDNCSQVAVALEVCRAIRAMLQAGEIAPLRRSVRVLLPMEVRGFNALIQNEDEIHHLRVGLNIDTVGTDQNRVTSICTLSDNFAALPSFAEEFAAELLERLSEENPLLRWRRTEAEMIDNIFGEPLIGAPTPAIWHYSATHHLATDTPDLICGRMLTDMARVTATYAAFLANAGPQESLWLAELVAAQAARRFEEVAAAALRADLDRDRAADLRRQLKSLSTSYHLKLASPGWLAASMPRSPDPKVPAEPTPERFAQRIAALGEQLDLAYASAETRLRRYTREFSRTEISLEEEATSALESRCVPLKAFRGFLGFEDLSAEEQDYLRSELGVQFGWGAPMWLQEALMFANGKRTAGEIIALLQLHSGSAPEVERLEQIFTFLAEHGLVNIVVRDS